MFKKPKFSKLRPNNIKPKTLVFFALAVGIITAFIIIILNARVPVERAPVGYAPVGYAPVEYAPNEYPAKDFLALAPGKASYTLRTGTPRNPQIIRAEFDPLDVKIGEFQSITIQVKDTDNEPITSKNTVQVILYTDNGSTAIPLALKKAEGSDLITTWEGVWECGDTHNFVYSAKIIAVSAAGESSAHITFR